MKKLVLSLLTAVVVVTTMLPAGAQDPEFSQFYAAPLHLNPALAGIAGGPRIAMNYRNEWPGIENAFVTYALSYDQHFDAISGGIGLQLLADRVGGGLLNTYSASAMYAYQLKLSRSFAIKIGAQAGYTYQQLDWNSLRFYDQINPVSGFVDEFNNLNVTADQAPDNFNVSYADFGAGFVAFSPTLYGGLGIKHVTQPKISYTSGDESAKLPLRVAIHGGAVFRLDERDKREPFISPNVLLAQQSNFTQINVGSFVNYNPIFGGVWYRHTISNTDAVIALVGFTIEMLRIGYSYDFTLSELSLSSGGTHEISVILNFGERNSLSSSKGALPCPPILN